MITSLRYVITQDKDHDLAFVGNNKQDLLKIEIEIGKSDENSLIILHFADLKTKYKWIDCLTAVLTNVKRPSFVSHSKQKDDNKKLTKVYTWRLDFDDSKKEDVVAAKSEAKIKPNNDSLMVDYSVDKDKKKPSCISVKFGTLTLTVDEGEVEYFG